MFFKSGGVKIKIINEVILNGNTFSNGSGILFLKLSETSSWIHFRLTC